MTPGFEGGTRSGGQGPRDRALREAVRSGEALGTLKTRRLKGGGGW